MDVEIRDEMIRLGQLLKLAGVVEDGGEARAAIEAGEVTVNGTVETRRGRQLHPGDEVAYAAEHLRVVRPADVEDARG
jgi:ribosome-associated protein